MEYQRSAPEMRGEYDVCVVGGGVAGVAAALAAVRSGMKTVLLEKTVLLGGLATTGLINWYEPLCDSCGKKLIGGISQELLHAAIKYGGDTLADSWRNGGDFSEKGDRYTTFFSPTFFALAMTEMLLAAGVTIRFDTLAAYPQMSGNHVNGVLTETKSGGEYYACRVLIDATGDADIFDRAGCPCRNGKNYMSYVGHLFEFDKTDPLAVNTIRRWKVGGSGMTGKGQPEGMPLFDGVNSDNVNTIIQRGQMLLLDTLRAGDKDRRELVSLPMMPQFRMSRHIIGEYELTGDDAYKSFDDSIGVYGDFQKANKGKWYPVPYRTLYNGSYDNMLAAGRIISSDGEAWMTSRVVPVAAMTGEVTGVAASLAIKKNIAVSAVDVGELRAELVARGNIVENK